MKTFIGYLNEALGDTSATTFFHEIICGIACYDPIAAAKIKIGREITI